MCLMGYRDMYIYICVVYIYMHHQQYDMVLSKTVVPPSPILYQSSSFVLVKWPYKLAVANLQGSAFDRFSWKHADLG